MVEIYAFSLACFLLIFFSKLHYRCAKMMKTSFGSKIQKYRGADDSKAGKLLLSNARLSRPQITALRKLYHSDEMNWSTVAQKRKETLAGLPPPSVKDQWETYKLQRGPRLAKPREPIWLTRVIWNRDLLTDAALVYPDGLGRRFFVHLFSVQNVPFSAFMEVQERHMWSGTPGIPGVLHEESSRWSEFGKRGELVMDFEKSSILWSSELPEENLNAIKIFTGVGCI